MTEQCAAAAGATPSDYGYTTPVPDPTLPPGIDTFTPPLLGQPIGPRIAEFTRTGSPNDTITVAGPDFTGATEFQFYGQTNADGPVTIDRPVNTADGTATCVVLPSLLPPWSMYLMWPANGNSYGMPVAVNRTDAWWIGSDQALAGATVSVYGRNLSYNNDTSTSWIYVKPVGNVVGQWVTPTAVNPYKVSFTVPSLTAGTYEVWTHNGRGGDFGWSGPLTLTVLAASPYAGQSSNVFDVQTYGAKGDGVTDDAPAIESALAAAGAGAPAEVYFPTGTYLVNEPLYVRTSVSWLGAGTGSSTIEAGPNLYLTNSAANDNPIISNRQGGSTGDFEISDLTISWNGNPNASAYAHQFMELINQNDITISDCVLSWKGVVGGTYIAQDNYVDVSGCTVTGDGIDPLGCSHVTLDNNNIYWTDAAETCFGMGGGSDYDISGNTGQDFNPSLSGSSGIGEGRLFASGGNNGTNSDVYIGDNQTIDAGPPSSGVEDSNGGEQILFEMGAPVTLLNPASATSTTATFSTALPSGTPNDDCMIVDGLGTGEARLITAVNGDTITVSPPWSIVPDVTSAIAIGASQNHTVAYDNTLGGKSNYATYGTAVVGTEWYGDCWDDIFANNNLTDICNGILSEFTQEPDSDAATPSAEYFNLVANNTLEGAQSGSNITTQFLYQNTPGEIGHLGNTYRWNSLTNIVDAGLTFSGATETSEYTGGNLDFDSFEHNTFTNLPIGIKVTPENTLFSNIYLYDNTFTRGTAALAGSIALDVTGTTTTFWRADDVWNGFATGTTDPNTVPTGPPPAPTGLTATAGSA